MPGGRHGPPVLPNAGAPGRDHEVRRGGRLHAVRAAQALRQVARGLPDRRRSRQGDHDLVHPAVLVGADDLRRRRAHAPARARHLGRPRPGDAEAANAAAHPGLGLPLAGRLLPADADPRHGRRHGASHVLVRQLEGRSAGDRLEAAAHRGTCSGARARPTRCASRCSASRTADAGRARSPELNRPFSTNRQRLTRVRHESDTRLRNEGAPRVSRPVSPCGFARHAHPVVAGQ